MHIKMKRLGNLKNGRQWLKLSTGGGIRWGVMEGKGICNVKLSTGGGIRWGATEGKGSYNVKSSDDTDIVSCFLLTQH